MTKVISTSADVSGNGEKVKESAMDIRGSLDGLKTLFGSSTTATQGTQVNSASQAQTTTATDKSAGTSAFDTDSVSFSSAASQVSQTATDESVRMDKVSAVQSALASGSYQVSSSAVASRLVDSMLGSQA